MMEVNMNVSLREVSVISMFPRRKKIRRWKILVGETAFGAMHQMTTAYHHDFPSQPLLGIKDKAIAITLARQILKYIQFVMSTPSKNRAGSSKYWSLTSSEITIIPKK